MIIECMIGREGNTEVSHAGVVFIFKPRPELTGDTEAKVCDVCADHAISRFLETPLYREYQKKEQKKEQFEKAKTEEQPKEDKKPVVPEKRNPTLKKKTRSKNLSGLKIQTKQRG